MGWYFRKSLRLGPVRFNLSKKGVGSSIGVKGFRVGIKANGKGYIHAGRYGTYYKKEFGAKHKGISPYNDEDHSYEINQQYNNGQTISHDTISAAELHTTTQKELLEHLNWAHKTFRVDFFVTCIFLLICFICYLNDSIISIILCFIIGIIAIISVANWEKKRRTIYLDFDFENNDTKQFEEIIDAFNFIANNNMLWSKDTSTLLTNTHISKLNAGASTIVNRFSIYAGTGSPPWVKTNLTLPVIKCIGKTLYFIPNGILIYDLSGVGIIDYTDLSFKYDLTRFIEIDKLPTDASVVNYTWRYPNKNGGPDRRFNDNYEIPICEYGEIEINSKSGTLIYIMTSERNAAENFCNTIKTAIKK